MSKTISLILHPVLIFIPILQGVTALMYPNLGLEYFTFALFFQAFLPVMLTLFLAFKKQISDLDISRIEQRAVFLKFMMVLYILPILQFQVKDVIFINIFLFLTVVLYLILTYNHKPSFHVGMNTLVIGMLLSVSAVFIFLSPLILLVSIARVVAGRHSIRQVLTGFTIGVLLSLLFAVTISLT